jgi:hypothetical protein
MLKKREAEDLAGGTTLRERTATFVRLYKQHGDIVRAATEAHISGGQARDLVQSHPELREDVISLLNRLGVTPERIVQEMARIALSDPRQMLDTQGRVLPMSEWPEDLARAVSGMDVTRRVVRHDDWEEEEITHKPRLWDKLGSLKELARMQSIAGAETTRLGNVPGERLRTDDGGGETREQIMLSLLALVPHKRDPEEEKGR